MTSHDTADSTHDDANRQPLGELCGEPMELRRFLELSISIAEQLAEIHKQNIIHKNIRPNNILFNPGNGSVTITGFTWASRLPYEHPTISAARDTGVSLAYMSPEQTGRMNRVVDYRTDFYSLGVTLYEMLTGTLPFEAHDAMEWVHCHIARLPRAPIEVIPTIPKVVSDIVMKLLAKTAEERYQTALGLKYDMERCLEQWDVRQKVDWFAPGAGDISDRLLIPQKLYGRGKDVDNLLNAFTRVLESGSPELVMVAGYSGTGKTSLVRELYKPIVRDNGFFISGKFDQYKRNIPYSTIVEAFRELIQQILTESEERVARWRKELQSALGINGQLLVDIIPQVEVILGKQPPVPELPLNEAENRFNMVFRQFIGVFARREHPLAVFLDDLQWVDSASLKLIEHIITYPEINYLFLIGAYRDNEVAPSHPLMLTLENIRKNRAIQDTITLSPLSFDNLGHLVTNAFGSSDGRFDALTSLVYEKTAGNPFFVIQFLITLHAEDMLEFDRNERTWKFDIARIQAKGYSDNVVELMLLKLNKLSAESRQILRLAACIGNRFDIETLAAISKISDEEARETLWEALYEGLLLRLPDFTYAFLHDRVHQAAYSIIPENQKPALHLQIGRLMLTRSSSETIDENIFDIVNQFNLGAALICDRDEKYRVAQLNLLAGKKATASTAYVSALSYLSLGAGLLDDRAWDTHYDLAFDLYKEFAVAEYMNSNYSHSKELVDILLDKAKSNIEKAQLYDILIVQYTVMAKYDEAIKYGRIALRLFNLDLPETDLEYHLSNELSNTREIIGNRSISSLIDLPEMTDPQSRVSVELLADIMVPARYSDSILFALTAVMTVNLSLKFGPISKSPIGYSAYGMILCSKNNHKEGYEFGELALKLSERFNDLSQKCRAGFVLGQYLNHWVKHLKWADEFNNDAYLAGMASGEMQWTGYSLAYKLIPPFYRGVRIDLIQQEIPNLLFFTRKTKNQWATDTLLGIQLALFFLNGSRGERTSLLGGRSHHFGQISESQYLAECRERRSFGAIGRYAVLRAQILFMYGRIKEALDAVLTAREQLGFFSCSISVAELNFYHSLILAALHDGASDKEREEYRGQIATNQAVMRTWVDNCKENFEHQYLLVEAEIARITGRELDAERLYEQAVQSARENEFVQDEGMASELASRFHLQRGFQTFAEAYLRKARDCYVRWGATEKVKQLDDENPWLIQGEQAAVAGALDAQIGHLDAISVVKASQAISGEIVLSNLLETLMRTLLQNAGAQKGCLILTHGDDLTIEAKAKVEGQEIIVIQPGPSNLASVVPMSMINFVRRTRERVILEDVSGENMFSSDPYIVNNKPMSVLCLPLLRQANLIGLLYLENSLVRGAFTTGRIAVVELLAAQAAISLENAALYLERSRAEDALRLSEEKYRTIFENSGTALLFIEEDMTISICNKEFEKLSGYTRVEVEGRKKWTEIVAKREDLERMKEYHRLRRVDPQAVPPTYEFKFIDRVGNLRDVVVTVATMPGMKQSLAALLDITERNQALKALYQSERKFRAIFDQSFQFMGLMNVDGTMIETNETALRFCGIELSEVIGKPFWENPCWSHSAELQEKLRIAVMKAAQGELVRFESTHPAADGSIHYVDFSIKPVMDGAGNVVLLIPEGRDITDLKKAEEERVRLVTAIEQAAEGVIVTDEGWTIDYVNPAFERMTGYGKSEIIGLNIRILKSGKHDAAFYKTIRDTLNRDEVWSGRLTNRKKDGTLYEAEVTSSPVRDKSGAIVNYVSILRDITNEVKLEMALRQAHKMEAIGTLAGGIAHDFNNILAAIVGFAEMALYKAPEGSSVRHYMERVIESASRATDLVKQILTFSRKAELERRPLAIAPIVKEAVKLLRSSLPTTIEIRLEVALPPDGGIVVADPTQIHQVLMNLCTNAAHAMRPRGGILTVNLSQVEVDASLVRRHPDLRPGPYVRLAVSDTGHGMDAAVMDRIFDPYFTTKGVGEGTGLGLSVVQGIVKSCGGAISVYSEAGRGTSFHVFLPRVEEEIAPQAREVEVLPTGDERILFVDDERPLVDLGKEMLESLGYSVSVNTNSLEALETFRAQPDAFDLVITDMTMPGLTGKELAKELMSIRSDIPIILCTGFSDLINEKQAEEIGIREFLMKPYVIASLAQTIRKVLERRE